ncbi:MAG: hypothetical protein RR911_01025 [Oscillospiraceae bacterium]
MDVNRLFSLQSNGYNIGEVDDYVGFIQTELTKNMKFRHDSDIQRINLQDVIKQLEAEKKQLNDKNQKLYRDCVSFAKRLKSLEVYDNSPEFETNSNFEDNSSLMSEDLMEKYNLLLEENKQLKSRLYDIQNDTSVINITEPFVDSENLATEALENSTLHNDYGDFDVQEFVDDDVFSGIGATSENEPEPTTSSPLSAKKLEIIEDEVIDFEETKPNKSIEELLVNVEKDTKDSEVKSVNSAKTKSRFARNFFNIIVTFILVLSIITSIVSIFTYIFVKTPNLNIFGYRAYTVQTPNDKLGYKSSDIIILKSVSENEIKPGDNVLCQVDKLSPRNIKLISSVATANEKTEFNVKDFAKDQNISKITFSSISGIINAKISYIGNVANYAFASPYDYIAILACILLLTIFLKIVIYLDVSKERRIKFEDYDISDFSLEI